MKKRLGLWLCLTLGFLVAPGFCATSAAAQTTTARPPAPTVTTTPSTFTPFVITATPPESPTAGNVRYRGFNAMSDVPCADIVLRGTSFIMPGLYYMGQSDYRTARPGSYTVDLYAAPYQPGGVCLNGFRPGITPTAIPTSTPLTGTRTLLTSTSVTLSANSAVTFTAYGSRANPNLTVLRDDPTAPIGRRLRVRLVNLTAAQTVEVVYVSCGNTVLATGIAPGQATDYSTFNGFAGDLTLGVRVGGTYIAFVPVAALEGSVQTVFFFDRPTILGSGTRFYSTGLYDAQNPTDLPPVPNLVCSTPSAPLPTPSAPGLPNTGSPAPTSDAAQPLGLFVVALVVATMGIVGAVIVRRGRLLR